MLTEVNMVEKLDQMRRPTHPRAMFGSWGDKRQLRARSPGRPGRWAFWLVAALAASCPRALHAEPPRCGTTATGFGPWLTAFRREAVDTGIHEDTVRAALASVRYDKRVIALDRSQKPFKKPFDEFVRTRVTPARIRQGAILLARHRDLLARILRAYGVPPHVVVALWGLETDFGALLGDRPVFPSLATLAFDCRRTERFRGELLSALRIVDRGDLRIGEMRGAWAGELGQTQFLASSYERFAVDFDGDGRADLRTSVPDALASTAHYLFQHDWLPGGDVVPGTANFQVLASWNRSENYQRTIALFAKELEARVVPVADPHDPRPRRKPTQTIRIGGGDDDGRDPPYRQED
jgi:membrane-bound lytic murein transglycosylase B